jgi:hypothetical protein
MNTARRVPKTTGHVPKTARSMKFKIYSTPSRGEVAGAARLQSPRRQKTRVGGGDDNRVEKGGLVTLMGTKRRHSLTKLIPRRKDQVVAADQTSALCEYEIPLPVNLDAIRGAGRVRLLIKRRQKNDDGEFPMVK